MVVEDGALVQLQAADAAGVLQAGVAGLGVRVRRRLRVRVRVRVRVRRRVRVRVRGIPLNGGC